MCPACISTAVLIVGSVLSTGGVAAIVVKTFGGKNATDKERNNGPGNDDHPQDRDA